MYACRPANGPELTPLHVPTCDYDHYATFLVYTDRSMPACMLSSIMVFMDFMVLIDR